LKIALYVLLSISLANLASAEECTGKTEVYEGKTVNFAICMAAVEDVIRASIDDHVFVAYIVKMRGQRVVVSDPLGETHHAVGDNLSFQVTKIDIPKDGPREGVRVISLSAFKERASKTDKRK
jgi:hypothetical protein